MWEFSLNLMAENFELAKSLFHSIKQFAADKGGVVTSHQQNGYISILIGADISLKESYENFLCKLLMQTICTRFKAEFLASNLLLPRQDKFGLLAFNRALINFDRETDYYLIAKALDFDKNLFLESFYQFKLAPLKAKWTELVSLANENREYLMSSESFLDLLKFLIDNLDIREEEVSVIEQAEGYRLYLGKENLPQSKEILSDEGLISSIIDLSPQKINLYCKQNSQVASLLEKIFVERIKVNVVSAPSVKSIKSGK